MPVEEASPGLRDGNDPLSARRVYAWPLTAAIVRWYESDAIEIAGGSAVADDGWVPPARDDATLSLHPGPAVSRRPGVRAIARELHEATRDLPLVCPHGHVDPRRLSFDEPFDDPVSMLVTPDHYVTRLLHAAGISLDELGVGEDALSEERARSIWRLLCGNWDVYRGTAVRYWLESQLVDLFGVTVRPSLQTADAIYDQILACLCEDAFRPRALYDRFGIEVLATTDDPCDDLGPHRVLAEDPTWAGRVIPTFRPDRFLEPAQPGWPAAIAELPRQRGSTRATTRAISGRSSSGGSSSSSMAQPRPTTAISMRAPIRSTSPTPSASTGPRSQARRPRPRRSRSGGTWCSRWRGCRATTGS